MTPHHAIRDPLRAHDGRIIPYVFDLAEGTTTKGVFVLLHGLGVDKDEYLGFYSLLAAMLVRGGYDVLRIDFPAHGESAAGEGSFTLTNCMADAIAACRFGLEQSRAKTLNVFGTSFGAGPAIAAARCFEENLERVTLLAPAVDYRELYIAPTYHQRKKFEGFFRRAVLDGERIAVGGRVNLTWQNAIEFAAFSLEADLKAIAPKTAIIHGDSDSMVPVELSRSMSGRFPSIELTVVERMDHGFMDRDDEPGTSESSQQNLRLIYSRAIR